mgnify:CR=1 FL=1
MHGMLGLGDTEEKLEEEFYYYRNWWRWLHWQQLYLSYDEKVSGLPHYLSG